MSIMDAADLSNTQQLNLSGNSGSASITPQAGVGPKGDTGATGAKGDTGATGAPGGSDASFAGWLTTPGSATKAAADAAYVALLATVGDISSTSTNGALTVGQVTRVDASGGTRAMTLADGTAKGQVCAAEKYDSSINAVTVTGKLRSASASSFTLTYQYETVLFAWMGTYWEPLVGHRTKSSIDTQINGLLSPLIASPLRPVLGIPKPRYNLFTTWASGHGWSDLGGTTGGSSNLNDTTTYELGSQSASVTVPAGGNRTIRATSLGSAVNLTGKNFYLLLQVDNPTNLNYVQIVVASDSGFVNAAFLRPTYGDSGGNLSGAPAVGDGVLRPGVWTPVHFTLHEESSTTGTPNLAAITDMQIRVVANAGAAVTVHLNAFGYFTPPSAYPNGVCSFTFDDTFGSHYTFARPALDVRGWAADAFVIQGSFGVSGFMTIAQGLDLEQNHGWSINAHATTSAQHNLGLPNVADPEQELRDLKTWISAQGFRGADLYATPKSMDNDTTLALMKRYFSFVRTTLQQPMQTTIPDYQALRVRSLPLNSTMTLAQAEAAVDAAYASGTWLIWTCHDLVASGPTTSTSWLQSDFTSLVAYIQAKGIAVRTITDVLNGQ